VRVLGGVPDYQQSQFSGSNTCAPVAAATVLGYWDSHGCGNLIDGSNSYESNPGGVIALVESLKRNMNWDSSGTRGGHIPPGILATASERGYSFVSYNDSRVFWSDIKAEVDASRPAAYGIITHPVYYAHVVTLTGYDENEQTRIVIAHDNWNWTPTDVYLNFSEITASTLTVIIPPGDPMSLSVQSSPVSGVQITAMPLDKDGQGNGITSFERAYVSGTNLSLTAPSSFVVASTSRPFIRWVLDGVDMADGQTLLQVAMTAAHTAVAVYQVVQRTLTVESTPISNVDITGDRPGITPFAAPCSSDQSVTLIAPVKQALDDNLTFRFVRWEVNGVSQHAGANSLHVDMGTDAIARATYRLAGDANGDCIVNILDLLVVRGNLTLPYGQSAYSGCDVNSDGAVDILDLLFVRQRLKAACPHE